jgi:hypothetical protein
MEKNLLESFVYFPWRLEYKQSYKNIDIFLLLSSAVGFRLELWTQYYWTGLYWYALRARFENERSSPNLHKLNPLHMSKSK